MKEESLKYIAEQSKELLQKQINCYGITNQKAGTVLAISALFAPLFLFLIERAQLWVSISAVIIIVPLIIGVILMLSILKAKELNRGYGESSFEELINKDIIEVYQNEITYNKYSIEQNDIILHDQKKKYNCGITLMIISIVLSIGLMDTSVILNSFFK